jgi:hypothetical protein
MVGLLHELSIASPLDSHFHQITESLQKVFMEHIRGLEASALPSLEENLSASQSHALSIVYLQAHVHWMTDAQLDTALEFDRDFIGTQRSRAQRDDFN